MQKSFKDKFLSLSIDPTDEVASDDKLSSNY